MKNYDYIILGTGPAGYKLASMISAAGKSLLAVEGGLFGGTCPNVGCEPKIFLKGAVHAALMTKQLVGRGISKAAELDWAQLMKTKKARFDSWAEETKANYQKLGDVATGYGKFVDAHTIEVNGEKFSGKTIIIATGRHPHRVNATGNEYFHDSTDVLSLDKSPKRAIFIGGGYVAMELSTFLLAAGTKITILDRADRSLGAFYSKYTKQLIKKMSDRGVDFKFGTEITKAEKVGDELVVTTNHGDEIKTDYIVDASGRVANTDLNLEKAGIAYDNHGITVDDHLETSAKGVYAVGDVTSQPIPKLTPVAELEADYLFDYLEKGKTEPFKAPTIGTACFAFPEVAQVGVNPDDAEKDAKYQVEEKDLSYGSAYAGVNDQLAHLTLVYDQEGFLVGASEISDTAADDINNMVDLIGLKIREADWNKHVMPIYPALAAKVGGILK